MSVWLTIPSKRVPEECEPIFKLWRERGYLVALLRDQDDVQSDLCIVEPNYQGYAVSVNRLIAMVADADPQAEWFIAAGDDVQPDLNHSAEEIGLQCMWACKMRGDETGTFGVMQPVGDRWGENPRDENPAWRSAYIDRVCGSAWIGREFAKRVNKGNGPLWPEYFHMGVDEELQAVARWLGVFWQRPDLIQFHQHWGRPKGNEVMGHRHNMPKFLERANSAEEWGKYKALFAKRKAAGFPGSEPL